MFTKKTIPALLAVAVLAVSVSSSAVAGDRYHGGGGGNGLAIAAGILGAVVVGSMIANANSAPSYAPPPQQIYAPQPQAYYPPQQVYYQQAQPVYVQPRYVQQYDNRYYRDDRGYNNGYYYSR